MCVRAPPRAPCRFPCFVSGGRASPCSGSRDPPSVCLGRPHVHDSPGSLPRIRFLGVRLHVHACSLEPASHGFFTH